MIRQYTKKIDGSPLCDSRGYVSLPPCGGWACGSPMHGYQQITAMRFIHRLACSEYHICDH